MSDIANEFARPARIDTIGDEDHLIAIEADETERAALARRFDLVTVDRLTAEVHVRRVGQIVHAHGIVRAGVVQSCVATGEPLPVTVSAPLLLRFVPEAEMAAQEEMELEADDCDTIGYDGAAVDLGEAAAETLYLALDPFPRAPDADQTLKAAGVVDAEDVGPFAALKSLRDKLGK
ncbi:YceD family protein [Sphingomonas solaris]|uniref:DUF177 domain-containing protein n=1 Tax=Alterirhizorhabdus solaris TaxID=2529389 RepID=A0A558R2T5_9SPHN|nr:DUF177 domain-containing protein [Sphingomonas solaris]TVV73693.1 DUF177 domain-containing protein [Sphingomonas solaris]